MKRLLLALLKLLLQLVLFALTGKWVKIGQPTRSAAPPQRAKQRPQQGGVRAPRAKVFDATRSPRPTQPASFEPASLEEVYLELEHHLPGAEAVPSTDSLLTGREPRRRARKRKLRELPPPSGDMSLARALRDRRSLREAVVLGAAFAPRRRDRRF